MHILHGTWFPDDNVFAVWGEDAGQVPSYRKGRRGNIAPHPFALTVDTLLRYITRFTTDSEPFGEGAIFWLPGHQKKVQPSPQALAAGAEPLSEELQLLEWDVPAVLLNPLDFMDLMLQLPLAPQGWTSGDDIAYWRQAILLLMNSLVEGRYLPALKQVGGNYRALWQLRADETTHHQLVSMMPPICRAGAFDIATALSPEALLIHCLDHCLNEFILGYYASHPHQTRHPWLKALLGIGVGQTNTVGPTNKTNQRLYKAWQTWQSLENAHTGNYKICFRLEEPSEPEDSWQLSYLLQANDDPSLLVAAEQVWASKGRQLDYLEHRFDQPQETLLAALGLAAWIFPPIEASLREAKPSGVALETAQAYTFLMDAAMLLESNGMGVLVPNWWGKRARLKAKASIKTQQTTSTGFLTRDSVLTYQWKASLGGEELTREEFEQLVALKQPIVRYRGEWLTLDPDQIEAMLAFFEQSEQSEGELSLLDVMKLTAQQDTITPDGIDVEETELDDWLTSFLDQVSRPQDTDVTTIPKSLNATLRPYQARGVGWLHQMQHMKFGACLADDMGLGKTIQTITYWLKMESETPALLICPTSVVGNWAHEISRFAPNIRYMKHQGANRLKEEAFVQAAEGVNVVLTSYALVHRDVETLQQITWSSVVLDEAQNIKNPSTKQAQAIRQLPADHKIALTGTPVENRLSELWSIFHFLNPGYLGSQKSFRSNFATPIERYGDQKKAAALKQLTAPFILRRVKTDTNIIQDLPDKFENKVYCSLTSEQATLYEAAVRDEMSAIEDADDDMQRRGGILRMLTRLKQICNHPAQFLQEGEAATMANRSGKLTRLVEMLEEIREVDERVLIFTQYAQLGTLLQTYLRSHFVDEVLFLHGGTAAKKRDEMVRRFQSENGPPIFILSLKAGGTGLNLTHANHVFHFDRWYNPAVENQATDRAFRIGQTKDVQVHKFICLGTLEERIDEMIDHKQALADQIIGEGESWISELGNSELRELVALRHDVMED